jgi:maltose alpha-D-glucosyltransferase / alpha-amylase
LVLPAIMNPLYGHDAVNVEAQSRDRHSMLNWTRRMLAVRGRQPAFGRGTLKLLYPNNRKVLAYQRELDGDALLCVANVARSPQAVELDLSQFAGRVPVELNAGSLFPPVGELNYLLTLPPYGFYWFALATASDHPSWHTPAPEPLPEFVTIVIRDGLAKALASTAKLVEEEVLPQYVAKRRWFAPKDQTIKSTGISCLVDIGDDTGEVLLTEIEVKAGGRTTRWLLPLAVLWEDEASASLPTRLALARVRRGRRLGLLTDAFALPSFAQRFVTAMIAAQEFPCADGIVRFRPTQRGLERLRTVPDAEINWLAAELSNSSLTVGDNAMLKVFRRISGGVHPETEMGRHLTAQGFTHAPQLLGDVVRIAPDGTPFTLAIAFGFVRNEGNAWSWILDHLTRTIDAHTPSVPSETSETDLLSDCEAVVAAIGRRLGEMHAILMQESSDPAFAPKIADGDDAENWARKSEERIQLAFESIARVQTWEREQDRERAEMLQRQLNSILAAVPTLASFGVGMIMTRVHGDFHLGQVLVADGDAYIIDFEGEPAAPIAERRAKTSPLRDVAGLLRSIDYVGATLSDRKGVGAMPVDEGRRDQLVSQFRTRVSTAFLRAYRDATRIRANAAGRALLDLFLIEKAAYEIAYEAANRPSWIGVPLAGLARLAGRILQRNPT